MAKKQDNGNNGHARGLSAIDTVRNALGLMNDQFKAVMPTQAHVDRFVRVVMTAVQGNVALAEEADRSSFYAAAMKCAQDGLMPDGKEAVLKIYNTNVGTKQKPQWKKLAAYEPMVEGLMKKLRNSNEIIGAPNVQVVYQNDDFEYELGDHPQITHKQILGDRGEIIGAYSIVTLKAESKVFDDEPKPIDAISREVMTAAEIDGIRARSKTPDHGPWKTDYGEMARKTVFKRHYKRLPRSTDLDNVIQYDNETSGLADVPQTQPAPVATAPALAPPEQRPAGLDKILNPEPVKEVVVEGVVTSGSPGTIGPGTVDNGDSGPEPRPSDLI